MIKCLNARLHSSEENSHSVLFEGVCCELRHAEQRRGGGSADANKGAMPLATFINYFPIDISSYTCDCHRKPVLNLHSS